MTYELLKLAHIIGAVLIGGGLIGAWGKQRGLTP